MSLDSSDIRMSKDKINLEREAEFLLVAALLIYIKSQMLLPRETVPEDEGEDPRRVLVDRLIDYQKIKAAGILLRDKEYEQQQNWQRTFLPPLDVHEDDEGLELSEVSLFDLAERRAELHGCAGSLGCCGDGLDAVR